MNKQAYEHIVGLAIDKQANVLNPRIHGDLPGRGIGALTSKFKQYNNPNNPAIPTHYKPWTIGITRSKGPYNGPIGRGGLKGLFSILFNKDPKMLHMNTFRGVR